MRAQIARFIASLSLVAMLTGCALDEPLGSSDQAFRSVNAGNTIGAPSGVPAAATSHSEILVGWTDNSTNENGFEVHSSWTGTNGTFYQLNTTGPGVTSTVHSGVSASTEYCYKVRTFVVKGRRTTYSAFSTVACATTPPLPLPSAPTDVVVKPISSYAVNLSWTAPVAGQDGFRIERSGSNEGPWEFLTTAIGTDRSKDDLWLPSETTFCFRLSAFNRYGSSGPSAADCTSIPNAPTDLNAIAVNSTAVSLTWTDNTGVEDGYEIRRAVADGPWSVLTLLPANAVSYQDEGLLPDSRYVYAIYARRDGGYSSSSNQMPVTTATAGSPHAPAYFDVMPQSSTAVTVVWSPSTSNADSYRLERSTDGKLTWSTILNGFAGTYVDVPAATELEACYRVIAVVGDRESVPSVSDCTTPPAAPTGLTIRYTDVGDIEFSWTDNSAVEDGYALWYSQWVCYEYNDMGECVPTLVDNPISLPPNTTRHTVPWWMEIFALTAENDGGRSDWVSTSTAQAASMAANMSRVAREKGVVPPRWSSDAKRVRVRPDKVRSANPGPPR